VAGAHGSQGTEGSCRSDQTIIAYWYRMSMITYKRFVCGRMAGCLFEWAAGKTEERGIFAAKGLKPYRGIKPARKTDLWVIWLEKSQGCQTVSLTLNGGSRPGEWERTLD